MVDVLLYVLFFIVMIAIIVGPLVFFIKLMAKGRSGLVDWPEQACESCDGTGRLRDPGTGSHTCLRCAGSGRITRA